MASKTYTSHELLRLRHMPAGKQLYDQLHEKLQNDMELCEIFRMPAERSLPLIKEEPSNTSGGSDDYEPVKKRVSRQLDGTDSEWKYRGRTESEQAEPQPIPAPTGLAAQKDEGFQRFYKAVVSPTHVRVTAGGRIVPNTRGPSSPTTKWIKDKASGDGAPGARSSGRDAAEQPHAAQAPGFAGPPPLFPGFVPGIMPPGYSHIPGAYPIMPWQMGFNLGNAFGLPAHALGQPPAPTVAAAAPNPNVRVDKQGEPAVPENQTPLRLSPPDHFDPTRPYFFNGQWLWSPYYPYGLPGAPGIPPAPMLGPGIAPQRFGFNPMLLPQSQSPRHHAQPGQAHLTNLPAPPPPSASCHVPPTKPPISSIRPSDITKKQIEVLRGSLRYFEDQIQYNKHQIDEKSMEHQAQIVREQIQQFGKNLESQLSLEEGNYPRPDARESSNSSLSSQNGIQSKSSTAGYVEPGPGNISTSSSRDDSSIVRIAKPHSSQDRSGDSSGNGSKFNQPTPALSASGPAIRSPSLRSIRKVSSLPVTAALAPPFQPRSDTTAAVLLSSQEPKQGSGEQIFKATTPSAKKSAGPLCEEKIEGEPYLVGRLPPNIRPEHAKDTDYIYPRQLTEDELRARHMYWGKAPRHLQKGLPKFDGKDFYPPSPFKATSSGKPPNVSNNVSNRAYSAQFSGSHVIDSRSAMKREADSLSRAMGQHGSRAVSMSGRQRQSEHSLNERSIGSSYAESFRAKTLRPSAKSAGNIRILVSPSESPSVASAMGGVGQDNDNEDHEDDKNLLFKGRNSLNRNSTKTHNDIWQSMMRRGPSSANVVQGTVTSMTAQGVLPQYAGHATASLTPAITNASVSPRVASGRYGYHREAETASSVAAGKQVENRPPGENKLHARRDNSACARAAPNI